MSSAFQVALLGVMFVMLIGAGTFAQTGLGLTGAILACVLVFGLSLRAGNWNPYRLLLIGVVVASGLNALLSLILVLAPQTAVKGMLFWLMGDLGYAENPLPALLMLALLFAVAMPFAPAMNVLVLGRMKGRSLGVSVAGIEFVLFGVAAVAAVGAVLVGGTVGFVGLIVPHLVRLIGLADHRLLLPGVVLVGGGFLTLADTVARSAWAPLQFPVDVLTALLGVPILLLLLAGKNRIRCRCWSAFPARRAIGTQPPSRHCTTCFSRRPITADSCRCSEMVAAPWAWRTKH